MLFRKDIEPRCEYCRHGTGLGDGVIACVKHGITSSGERCAKFKYDPFKREPEAQTRIRSKQYSMEDFKL